MKYKIDLLRRTRDLKQCPRMHNSEVKSIPIMAGENITEVIRKLNTLL